jgi:hypothetical protein
MGKQMLHVLWAMMAIGAFSYGANPPGKGDLGRREATFDPSKDEFITLADPWMSWSSKELIEATRMNAAQAFVVRYYVQKVGDASGRLAYVERTTRWSTQGTVFADGTLFLVEGERWIWAKPNEMATLANAKLNGEQLDVLAAYPDGAVVQPKKYGTGADRLSPLYWVPFKDRLFDGKSRRRLTADDGMMTFSGVRIVRRGTTIAWIDTTRMNDSMPVGKRLPPRLFEFDVASGVVRQRQFSKEQIAEQTRVLAFDAKYFYTGYEFVDRLIDRSTGLVRRTPIRFSEVRGGFVYNTSETPAAIELTRAPLDKPSEIKVLHRFTDETILRTRRLRRNNESMNGVVLFGEGALYVWKGARWQKIEEWEP